MKELYEKTCAALMTHSYPNTGVFLGPVIFSLTPM